MSVGHTLLGTGFDGVICFSGVYEDGISKKSCVAFHCKAVVVGKSNNQSVGFGSENHEENCH